MAVPATAWMDVERWRRLLVDPRVIDAALVLGCLFLTVLAVKTPWSPGPGPVVAVVGVLGSLAQWYRRRLPLTAAGAGALACAVGGNPGPLLVGVYSAASYAARRYVGLVALIGWAGFAGWAWFEEGRLGLDDVVSSAGGAAVVAAAGLYTATGRALASSWRSRAEDAESARRLREESARAAERDRIAHEMHDLLAHQVSLIALHAGALELAAQTPRTREAAALIRVTARQALQELRHVLGLLHAGPDEPFADLASLVDAAVRAGHRVDLQDRVGQLPADTARVVHRIAQEGLTNARKHAPDAPVVVVVDADTDNAVNVAVRNGPSGAAAMDLPGSGTGLIGLAERVRLVGGSLHSGPSPDGGWELRAVIPRSRQPKEIL